MKKTNYARRNFLCFIVIHFNRKAYIYSFYSSVLTIWYVPYPY